MPLGCLTPPLAEAEAGLAAATSPGAAFEAMAGVNQQQKGGQTGVERGSGREDKLQHKIEPLDGSPMDMGGN